MSEPPRLPPLAFHHTITSDTANLAGVRESVAAAAARIGFAKPIVSQVVLAVDEAVTNVIKHGYQGRSGEPIEVSIDPIHRDGRDGLEVTVCDCGGQVDPGSIVGRPLDDVRPGGLGTHIIRSVMDEVEYSIRDPLGMRLRMAKWLAGGEGNVQVVVKPREGSGNVK